MTLNTCRADGCRVRVPDAYLMCKAHWVQVDQPTRLLLNQLHAQLSNTDDLALSVNLAKKYREAVDLAVDQVARKSAISHPEG